MDVIKVLKCKASAVACNTFLSSYILRRPQNGEDFAKFCGLLRIYEL